MVIANKTVLKESDARRLLAEVDMVYAGKGKRSVQIDLRKEKIDKAAMSKFILGPTGNLRAPTIRKGKTLLVGFDEESYNEVFRVRPVRADDMEKLQLKPIGIIHTPFKSPEEAPGSARGGEGISGTVEIYPEYGEGLADLDGFSHIILIFLLHLSKGYALKVVPRLDNRLRGLFATRASRRPNPIGVSIVKLDKIEGTTLYVSDIDMVDGTPLLDIKPYIPYSEEKENVKIGWLSGKLKSG